MHTPAKLEPLVHAAYDVYVWITDAFSSLFTRIRSVFVSQSTALVAVTRAKKEKKKQSSKATKKLTIYEAILHNLRVYLAGARVQCARAHSRMTPSWHLPMPTASYSRMATPLVLATTMCPRWISTDYASVVSSLGSWGPLSVLPLAPALGAPAAGSLRLALLKEIKNKMASKKKETSATSSASNAAARPRPRSPAMASSATTFALGSLGPLSSLLPFSLAAWMTSTEKRTAPTVQARSSSSLVLTMGSPMA